MSDENEPGGFVVDMILELPEGGELRWYADDIAPERPYGVTWVDVWIGDVMAWTIVPVSTSDSDEIPVEPDMLQLSLTDPRQPGHPEVWSLAIPYVQPTDLPDNYASAIAAGALAHQGCDHAVRPAWSIAKINETIELWCAGIGRRIKAVWDSDHGPSPMVADFIAQMEAMKEGTTESYVLMPGEKEGGEGYTVRVAGPVMDTLAQLMIDDPEAAQAMLDAIGAIKEQGPARDDSTDPS